MSSVSMRMNHLLQEHNLLTEDVIVRRLSGFLEQHGFRIEADTTEQFVESFDLILREEPKVADALLESQELTELWKTLGAGLAGAALGGLMFGPGGAVVGAKLGVAARAGKGAYNLAMKAHDKIQDYRISNHNKKIERAKRRLELARAPHEVADMEKHIQRAKNTPVGEDPDLLRDTPSTLSSRMSRHRDARHWEDHHGDSHLRDLYDLHHEIYGVPHKMDPRYRKDAPNKKPEIKADAEKVPAPPPQPETKKES